MSKKLEQKQQRRLAEERKKEQAKREQRKKNMITLLVAALVMGLVAFLVISERKQESGPIGVAADEANCGDKEEVEAVGNDHIDPGTAHEAYNSTPPTNGPHWPVGDQAPVPKGFYDTAQAPEAVIHNLEHGDVVLWYSPDAPQQVKDDLETLAERNVDSIVATPFEGLEEHDFFMTAWNKLPGDDKESFGTGYLQGCDVVSEEVINEFRAEHQGRSPEPITPTFDG